MHWLLEEHLLAEHVRWLTAIIFILFSKNQTFASVHPPTPIFRAKLMPTK